MPAFFLALYLALWAMEGRPFSSLSYFFLMGTPVSTVMVNVYGATATCSALY